ncbi:ribonuclease P protein component [Sphingobacterium suaedae]|uniref:Ribonuclease P protein component n=1 Tax=Sphingobacterium suaedae TaxID=1686402 RepID=A0ABW5KHQ7_9SPHI
MKNYTFKKEERLCSKRRIDRLFHNGSSFVVYPYRVVYLNVESFEDIASPSQCIISVSKRKFKRAVDRNRLKRQMREVYRLQKSVLYEFLQEHSLHLLVAFQYIGKDDVPYVQLFQRMGTVLGRLQDEIHKLNLAKGD